MGAGRVPLTRTAAALVALTAVGASACRTARPERPINATCGAEGFLRVRNFTGRVLEVYELARGHGQSRVALELRCR
jgi:hypothetical protein